MIGRYDEILALKANKTELLTIDKRIRDKYARIVDVDANQVLF